MGRQAQERVEEALAQYTRPGAMVLECSALSQFRSSAATFSGVPVFDLLTTVHGVLGLSAPAVER